MPSKHKAKSIANSIEHNQIFLKICEIQFPSLIETEVVIVLVLVQAFIRVQSFLLYIRPTFTVHHSQKIIENCLLLKNNHKCFTKNINALPQMQAVKRGYFNILKRDNYRQFYIDSLLNVHFYGNISLFVSLMLVLKIEIALK